MTDKTEAPEHDQFMTKVEKTDSCWVWKGAKSKNGYGRFRSMSAHRFSYEAHIGEIHPDMTIDHICRNTSCVNPDHLRQLTQYQNNMLGNGFTAVNRRKTHCINGHALSGDNIVIIERSDGTRRKCKVCEREQKRRYRKEKKMKRTDACAEVKPLVWEADHGKEWRIFYSDTCVGRYTYGTDNTGQAYWQDNKTMCNGYDVASEDMARECAERQYRRDLLATPYLNAVTIRPAPEVETFNRESVIDHIEQIVSETHDIDTTDRHYAENVFDGCIDCISVAIREEIKHARKEAYDAGYAQALEDAVGVAQLEAASWHSDYSDTVKFACDRIADHIRAINKESGGQGDG